MASTGLKRYVEWMSRGRLTGRVAYVSGTSHMPPTLPGAEWQIDANFNAAEELLKRPRLKSTIRAALAKGAEIVEETP